MTRTGGSQLLEWGGRRATRAFFGLCLACLVALQTSAEESAADARRKIALEALSRLKGTDLETNPALKSVVLKTLDQVQGTPDYVTLIEDFKIAGHETGLLDVTIRHPATDAAANALRLLVERDAIPLLTQALSGTNAAALMPTLGTSADRRVIGLLEGIVCEPSRDPALRRQAVRALCASRPGTSALLEIIRAGRLPADLNVTARTTLQGAGGLTPEELAGLLPLLKEVETLPPVSELTKRTGSVTRGAEVYRSEKVGCALCHQINGKGIDFGPNLSEIGAKLGKDALYDSILNPNAGISFGYEAWEIELKNGDEISGMIVSETENEVAVKVSGGTVTRHPKSEILRRRKLPGSIMPGGLQQTMSTQDFVDLVEFLSSLKKAAAP
jgi:putative heme-binding domain-containing protein